MRAAFRTAGTEENTAEHAQKDASKARNSSDLLKAREANLKYEVDDLGTTLLGSNGVGKIPTRSSMWKRIDCQQVVGEEPAPCAS